MIVPPDPLSFQRHRALANAVSSRMIALAARRRRRLSCPDSPHGCHVLVYCRRIPSDAESVLVYSPGPAVQPAL